MLATKKLKADIDMCSRPLLRKVIMFSLPLVFTGILQLLYNAADIIVVGRFDSEHAMAAVGSTGALVNLITNLFIGLSTGALAAMAKAIGSKNKESAERIVHTSILVSVIGGVIIGLVGYFMSAYFLKWMGTPEEILSLSTQYLKIFFIGMPFNLLYNFGASILRACGDTKNPLIFLTIAGLVNVGLNLIFVIKLKMSVAGVAWATIIAQAISAILVVICLMRRKEYGKLRLKRLRISRRAMLEIFKIGFPAGIQGTIFSFSNVIIQSAINSMGALAVAGNAAASNIEGFVYTSMNAVSQACLTFTGQNFGANKKENCKIVFLQTIILTFIVGITLGVTAYFLGAPLIRLYNTNSDVVKFGLERLKIVGLTYFTCGFMEVVVGSLRGIGKSTLPMLVSIVGVVGVRVAWIFTVFAKTQNLKMLYWSYPISWVITTFIHIICLIYMAKKVFKNREDEVKLVVNNVVLAQPMLAGALAGTAAGGVRETVASAVTDTISEVVYDSARQLSVTTKGETEKKNWFDKLIESLTSKIKDKSNISLIKTEQNAKEDTEMLIEKLSEANKVDGIIVFKEEKETQIAEKVDEK